MGKASNRKKQQRQQGGRRNQPPPNRLPLAFIAVAAAAFIGVLLLALGGGDDDSPLTPGDVRADDGPAVGDHWHAAIGFYVCDDFVGPFRDAIPDELGIHSHGDGLIHIHPLVEAGAGENATLGKFMDQIGAEVAAARLELPRRPVKQNGDACGDKPGKVRVVTWDSADDSTPTVVLGDPAELKLRQNQLISVAFVPDGADVPKPPSAALVQTPGDI